MSALPKLDFDADLLVVVFRAFNNQIGIFHTVFLAGNGLDHAIVRFGLTTLLQYENDIEVVAGESVIPRELKCARPPEQPVDLSDQEREVLAAIARGLTNKDISAMTGLSKDIAKHLISELFAKLGVANRAEAAALAIRKQLVKM